MFNTYNVWRILELNKIKYKTNKKLIHGTMKILWIGELIEKGDS